MRRFVLLAFVLLCTRIPAGAQEECRFGGEENFNALVKALSEAKTCGAAAAKFNRCAWGSSADKRFASIVIEKCEKTFLDQLSPAARQRYNEELELCAYRYARQVGTMWMAAEAACAANVAAHFAADPAAGSTPAPPASFDCDKAQTPLEKAICSDVKLGHADIVLSRAYSERLKNPKEGRPALVRNQEKWLRRVPAKCSVTAVPLSQESLACIRNEFEERFMMLDSCVDKVEDCSPSPGDRNQTSRP